MTGLEKLSLLVLGSLAVLWMGSWVLAEIIIYLTEDEK